MQEEPIGRHDDDICGSLWMDIQLMQPSDFSCPAGQWAGGIGGMASLLVDRLGL